jgi:ABC-2 type transport system permease protein
LELGGKIMQVFKAYFKILNKHKISVIIYTVMFLAITIAITSKIDVSSDKFEVKKVKIMVVNNDGKSALTDGFLDYLKSYATFVEPKGDEEARRESLFFGETEYILTIPEGFSDSFIKGKAMTLQKQTIPNSMEAMSIDNVIDSYLNIAKVYLKDLPGLDSKKMNITKNANTKNKLARSSCKLN